MSTRSVDSRTGTDIRRILNLAFEDLTIPSQLAPPHSSFRLRLFIEFSSFTQYDSSHSWRTNGHHSIRRHNVAGRPSESLGREHDHGDDVAHRQADGRRWIRRHRADFRLAPQENRA